MKYTQKKSVGSNVGAWLCVPMPYDNDAGANDIGEYLRAQLKTLWHEGEGFSGKRPFGNSGWKYDIVIPLIKAGYLDGEIDEEDIEYPELVDFDEKEFDTQINFVLGQMDFHNGAKNR